MGTPPLCPVSELGVTGPQRRGSSSGSRLLHGEQSGVLGEIPAPLPRRRPPCFLLALPESPGISFCPGPGCWHLAFGVLYLRVLCGLLGREFRASRWDGCYDSGSVRAHGFSVGLVWEEGGRCPSAVWGDWAVPRVQGCTDGHMALYPGHGAVRFEVIWRSGWQLILPPSPSEKMANWVREWKAGIVNNPGGV